MTYIVKVNGFDPECYEAVFPREKVIEITYPTLFASTKPIFKMDCSSHLVGSPFLAQ